MTGPTTLFRAEWGSRAYGTHNEHSDRDIIQVLIEPPECITGLREFKAKATSTAETGQRSTSEDTDTVTYGLKKYAGLAVDGNPQVMATLWLNDFIVKHPRFDILQGHRLLTVSKNAGRKYLGYMKSQRMNMEGLKKGKTNRPELVQTHGYDTKFAMHAVRLGLQGYELMTTGNITLPLREDERQLCLDIRAGKISKQECLDLIYDLEAKLEEAIEKSDMPEHGDQRSWSYLLHNTYLQDWGYSA